jgi:hypothetical protein
MNTYTKLRDGTWGLKVTEPVSPGQVITVTTKSGESRKETVIRTIWTGPTHSVCTFAAHPRKATKSRLSNGRCRECRGPIVDAPHCKAREGLCGSCAFDDE